MVFGTGGAKDSIEETGLGDARGNKPVDLPPISVEAAMAITEAQAALNNASLPYHQRLKNALLKTDEAIAAFPDCPQVLIYHGNLRYQNLDLHFARLSFEKLRSLYPDVTQFIPPLIRIAIETGDFEKASMLIDALVEKDGETEPVIVLKAEILDKSGEPQGALALISRLITDEESEGNIALKNTAARLYLEIGDPDNALEILKPHVMDGTNSSEAHRLYADALAEVGNMEGANASYGSALYHNPNNLKARYNLGVLLREMGLPQKAKDELAIVSSIDPSDADAHYQLFELALEANDTGTALTHALEFLLNADEVEDDDLAGEFVAKYTGKFTTAKALLYGEYLIDIGDVEEAVEFITPYLEDPDTAPPFEVLMSEACMELDDFKKSLDWTSKALDRYEEDEEGFIVCEHPHPPDEVEGGEFAELVCSQAGLHLRLGEVDNALDTLEELGEDDSLAHLVHRIRGEAAFISGKYEESLEHFKRALEESPADVDVLVSLGSVYYKLGDHNASINYYLRAFINDPEDFSAAKSLAMQYLEMGWGSDAKLFLRKYMDISEDDEGLAWAAGCLKKYDIGNQ